MHLLAALDVNVQNDSWSIAVAVATIVAAIGTVGAVLVALFLPLRQARKSQPKVRLELEAESWERSYDGDGMPIVLDGPQLLLTNEAGRATARGVEVLASVYLLSDEMLTHDGKPGPVVTFVDVPLNHSANDGTPGRESTNVGPGAVRRVYLARIGPPEYIHESWLPGHAPPDEFYDHAWCGAWATYPARRDQLRWIEENRTYLIELLVTGDNFDAFRLRGTARFDHHEWRDELLTPGAWNHPLRTNITWTEKLKKVKDRIEPVA